MWTTVKLKMIFICSNFSPVSKHTTTTLRGALPVTAPFSILQQKKITHSPNIFLHVESCQARNVLNVFQVTSFLLKMRQQQF